MRWAAILAALAIALASPVPAFDIDYARLFAETPEAVSPVGEQSRRLDLPGPVVVMETTASDGSKSYMGLDESPAGAVGCTFRLLLDLSAMAEVCPALLDPAQTTTLADRLERTADYMAANTVPPVAPGDIATRLAALIAARTAHLKTAVACDDKAMMEEARPFITTLTGPSFKPILDQQLAVPRLPVAHPCL